MSSSFIFPKTFDCQNDSEKGDLSISRYIKEKANHIFAFVEMTYKRAGNDFFPCSLILGTGRTTVPTMLFLPCEIISLSNDSFLLFSLYELAANIDSFVLFFVLIK